MGGDELSGRLAPDDQNGRAADWTTEVNRGNQLRQLIRQHVAVIHQLE